MIDDIIKELQNNYPNMINGFQELQKEMFEVFCKKQYDYGPGNILLGGNIDRNEDCKAALRGIVIRMNDKMNRLINMTLKKDFENPQNESIEDSFKDLSVYSLIALLVISKKWSK